MSSTGAKTERDAESNQMNSAQIELSRHEQIANLAYSYWQARGCPHGSPEEDWLRAELDLRTDRDDTEPQS